MAEAPGSPDRDVIALRVSEGTLAAEAVDQMVEEVTEALGPGAAEALAQLAHLPLLDPAVVDLVAGAPGYFHRARVAGTRRVVDPSRPGA